jgi:hypothetical protein
MVKYKRSGGLRAAYLSRNRRFTKSRLAWLTSPFLAITRLRFFDFFVRMCRLKAFWKVILPVPVILNRFLALEFVFTFGILNAFVMKP